ncbi:MAG TPA: glycoside hydrolase family 18 protein [Lachnospiraceae bacterium]|nr:glycoside hydrolase family 18 protein [Lachnospiraceae bacterium]
MNKLIGYVGTNDLHAMKVDDIKSLDIINIAFGNIKEGVIVWEHPECMDALNRIREYNPEMKILLSVGGWSSGGFSEAAMTVQSRSRLAQSAVEIVIRYGLDGIDIDWEYPCFSVAGIAADKADKQNYTLLMKDLREALESIEKGRYMLTTAVGGDEYFCRCTQMDKVQEYVDYVQLMTYDLRGGFQTFTGHHTNLFSNQADLFDASTDKAVRCFMEAGVPKEKLVIGVAFYSREWKGVCDVNHGLHQMAQTTGGYGPNYHTLVEEYIDKNGYIRYWDKEAKAPYLFNGEHFISYDDEESIKCKAEYAKDNGLFGMMYWEYCCDHTYRLTTWMRKQLDR